MAKKEIELGKKITVSGHLRRRSEYRQDNKINEYANTEFKEWVEKAYKHPKEVIIIGVRTLSNGYNIYDSEAGNMYQPLTYFGALLVVEDLRSKPFYILNTF